MDSVIRLNSKFLCNVWKRQCRSLTYGCRRGTISNTLCPIGHYASRRGQHKSLSAFYQYLPLIGTEKRRFARLPVYIQEKLENLQLDMMQTLMKEDDSATAVSSYFSSALFTEKFQEMAKHYFNQGGKLFRPMVCLMMARACNEIEPETSNVDAGRETVTTNQYKIAVISEMIHTASLVHDDVIDGADMRRGSPTVNALWGNKMAVLVGDFILARSTQVLSSIGRPSVISVMASIIEDLVEGEFMQMSDSSGLDLKQRYKKYMAKTYSKTASLFANSCKSAAMLSDVPELYRSSAYEYGKSLGIAFQMIDDMLDFISTSAVAGKPVINDLNLGLATAPVLFAAEEYPQLNQMINRRFSREGDVKIATEIVGNSTGLKKTRSIAEKYAQKAVESVNSFPNKDGIRDNLIQLALSQVDRDR